MVLLAWDNKKATTQLKEMCEQHPVDFFLLKRCAANTSALRDVIRGIAKCRVDYTPREIVDIDAALESTLYGNNTGEWKEKLQQFAPDTVSDKELAAWMKERSLVRCYSYHYHCYLLRHGHFQPVLHRWMLLNPVLHRQLCDNHSHTLLPRTYQRRHHSNRSRLPITHA